jgi:Mlc titration factor MtfA (ptsG expression regulator)
MTGGESSCPLHGQRYRHVCREQTIMLVTPETNRRNRNHALALAGATAGAAVVAGWFSRPVLPCLGLSPFIYWWVRRRCLRRLRTMHRPFPASWEQVLQSHVAFFRALPEHQKERFRQLVEVFLDEVRITGIQTEVDDTIRVLVAASAAIPVFGFHDWEYHRLGEVLVYPSSFGEEYQTTGEAGENTLGMVGLKQLRGVMILSKPSLLAGFDTPSSRDNVGIHEFAHLVELEEAEHGLPPEVPWPAVKHWVRYVARELSHPSRNRSYLRDYAYTNQHEFFAVLAEYFFDSPELLKRKDPQLYGMLREMFHQDTASLMKLPFSRRSRYGRNDPCPCGSGKKYKHCCLLRAADKNTPGAIDGPSAPLAKEQEN